MNRLFLLLIIGPSPSHLKESYLIHNLNFQPKYHHSKRHLRNIWHTKFVKFESGASLVEVTNKKQLHIFAKFEIIGEYSCDRNTPQWTDSKQENFV